MNRRDSINVNVKDLKPTFKHSALLNDNSSELIGLY